MLFTQSVNLIMGVKLLSSYEVTIQNVGLYVYYVYSTPSKINAYYRTPQIKNCYGYSMLAKVHTTNHALMFSLVMLNQLLTYAQIDNLLACVIPKQQIVDRKSFFTYLLHFSLKLCVLTK